MADINSGSSRGAHDDAAYRSTSPVARPAATDADEALVGIVELLFFAYRDFTGEADAVLQDLGLGRAHHRVLHFVNRQPGLRVADLLDILRITKQSLARVLKQLVDGGYIDQMAGVSDRRERRLYVTFRGESLARELTELQAARVAAALAQVGEGGEAALKSFLSAMIEPGQRASIAAGAPPSGGTANERASASVTSQTAVGDAPARGTRTR